MNLLMPLLAAVATGILAIGSLYGQSSELPVTDKGLLGAWRLVQVHSDGTPLGLKDWTRHGDVYIFEPERLTMTNGIAFSIVDYYAWSEREPAAIQISLRKDFLLTGSSSYRVEGDELTVFGNGHLHFVLHRMAEAEFKAYGAASRTPRLEDFLQRLRRLGATFQTSISGQPVGISLENSAVTAEDLAALPELTGLVSVSLAFTLLGDETVPILRNLQDLRHLNLNHCEITERGFQSLGDISRLTELRLGGLPLTMDCVPQIQAAAQLRRLHLRGSGINSWELRPDFKKAVPHCVIDHPDDVHQGHGGYRERIFRHSAGRAAYRAAVRARADLQALGAPEQGWAGYRGNEPVEPAKIPPLVSLVQAGNRCLAVIPATADAASPAPALPSGSVGEVVQRQFGFEFRAVDGPAPAQKPFVPIPFPASYFKWGQRVRIWTPERDYGGYVISPIHDLPGAFAQEPYPKAEVEAFTVRPRNLVGAPVLDEETGYLIGFVQKAGYTKPAEVQIVPFYQFFAAPAPKEAYGEVNLFGLTNARLSRAGFAKLEGILPPDVALLHREMELETALRGRPALLGDVDRPPWEHFGRHYALQRLDIEPRPLAAGKVGLNMFHLKGDDAHLKPGMPRAIVECFTEALGPPDRRLTAGGPDVGLRWYRADAKVHLTFGYSSWAHSTRYEINILPPSHERDEWLWGSGTWGAGTDRNETPVQLVDEYEAALAEMEADPRKLRMTQGEVVRQILMEHLVKP